MQKAYPLNGLVPSLPLETQKEIVSFLNDDTIIKLRCVSSVLKRDIDSWNEKWIEAIAHLSFFHLPYEHMRSISDDSTWCHVFAHLRKYQTEVKTLVMHSEFHPLPDELNFFGENLTKVKSVELDAALDDYVYLWSDYMNPDDQFDNYFVNLTIFKRPGTCEHELPFEMEETEEFDTQYEELVNTAVCNGLLDISNVLPSEVCRPLPSNGVVSDLGTVSALKIYMHEDNMRKCGCFIYQGRSFLASPHLRRVLNTPSTSNDETNNGIENKTEAKAITPYTVVTALSDALSSYFNDDPSAHVAVITKQTETLDFDVDKLFPNGTSDAEKDEFKKKKICKQ